ncbi:dihydropyrimidine dehydrogenase, partial [Escherichia coli]
MPQQNYLDELTPAFTSLLAIKEASRCLLCHDAPCSQACPAQTDPGKFIRSIYFRNFKGAAGNDSNLLIVFYVQIMPDDFVMQLHR